uniref:Uncharacterized protein n=1 Tax=Candidatus Methanophaga sp. ANME-1 ERB7 TaxID=2759913 RepID=A0A7G9Z854_9EURY|nr:hypothetical protein OHJJKADD_00010 [Methanosarcinales archaeon ANME-1 ERB7]
MNSQTKKSERKNDKTVALELNYLNTKSKSKPFGEVELKYISFGNVKFFVELLNRTKDNKEFVIQVLYHQLITPQVSLTEFSKISDEELIKLARDFVEHEQHTFRYFKETTDAEFFTNFGEAIKRYFQKQDEQLQATIDPIKAIKKTFEDFNKQYAGIIKQTIKQTSYITESIKEISKVAEQFREAQLRIAESLRPVREAQLRIAETFGPVIKQYQLNARNLAEVLTPQINNLQKWVEQNKKIFDSYTKFWQAFKKRYRIAEQEAIRILRKYKWFITPSLPLDFVFDAVKIGKGRGNQRKAINRLFADYFSSDNFKNLENLVDGWETNKIFKLRMKVFRDCVFAVRNAKDKCNPSNFVLPTLIAQIDGIRIEFMDRNGLSFWTKDKVWKGWFSGQTPNQELLDLANDIFLNILFQKSQPGKPLETPFTFNRHKIMHGEYLRYGRIDNTIRAFLILDFLATLSE